MVSQLCAWRLEDSSTDFAVDPARGLRRDLFLVLNPSFPRPIVDFGVAKNPNNQQAPLVARSEFSVSVDDIFVTFHSNFLY